MKLTSKIALIAAFGTVAASSLFAAPAMAAPSLPSCVSVRHRTGIVYQTVYIKNNCRGEKGWIVDKEAGNSKCFKINAGKSDKHSWNIRDRYHGTYAC